jgi:hypothetical protein
MSDFYARSEDVVNKMERYGTLVGRFLLSTWQLLLILAMIITLIWLGLVASEKSYRTNPDKYQLKATQIKLDLSKINIDGHPLTLPELTISLDLRALQKADQSDVIADLLSIRAQTSNCYVKQGSSECETDLARRTETASIGMTNMARQYRPDAILPLLERNNITITSVLQHNSLDDYIGDSGFPDAATYNKMLLAIANQCHHQFLDHYNTLPYVQNKMLYFAVSFMCLDRTIAQIEADMAARPRPWTALDETRLWMIIYMLGGIITGIILFTLIIVSIRIEYNLRYLKNLKPAHDHDQNKD